METNTALVESIEAPKRRRHFRFQWNKDATVTIGNEQIHSRVINASSAGICFEIDKAHSLSNGTSVTIDWPAPKELQGSDTRERCVTTGTVVRSGSSSHASRTYSMKFPRSIQEQLALGKNRPEKAVVGLLAVSLAVLIGFLKAHNFIYFWYDPWLEAYSIGAAVFVLSRIFLSFFYKEPADHGYFPTVSIIIAAKNEEAHIADTVEHCFRSNYPPNLMEVFAVDDGSTDGTWEVMQGLEKNTHK